MSNVRSEEKFREKVGGIAIHPSTVLGVPEKLLLLVAHGLEGFFRGIKSADIANICFRPCHIALPRYIARTFLAHIT